MSSTRSDPPGPSSPRAAGERGSDPASFDGWDSRRRLRTTLEHRQPDRVCVDLGAYTASGIAASTLSAVRRALGGDPDHRVRLIEPFLGLGEVDEFVRQEFGVDVVGVWTLPTNLGFRNTAWKPWRLMDGTPVLVSTGFDPVTTPEGNLLFHPGNDRAVPPSAMMPKGGFYFDPIVRQDPIDEDHLDVQGNLDDFQLLPDELVADTASEVERLATTTHYGIFLRFPYTWFGDPGQVPGPGLRHPRGIRDPEEWLISHVTRPAFLDEVYGREVDIAIRNLELLAPVLGDRVDVVKVCSTDFGTQRGPIDLATGVPRRLQPSLPPPQCRDPPTDELEDLQALLRQHLRADPRHDRRRVRHPQPGASIGGHMDPRTLKREFGDDLVLWGGGVDTQRTLPFGTPDEVYREVRERIDIFNTGGGYVFSPEHNIQANVPVENVLAMYRAVRDSDDGTSVSR